MELGRWTSLIPLGLMRCDASRTLYIFGSFPSLVFLSLICFVLLLFFPVVEQ